MEHRMPKTLLVVALAIGLWTAGGGEQDDVDAEEGGEENTTASPEDVDAPLEDTSEAWYQQSPENDELPELAKADETFPTITTRRERFAPGAWTSCIELMRDPRFETPAGHKCSAGVFYCELRWVLTGVHSPSMRKTTSSSRRRLKLSVSQVGSSTRGSPPDDVSSSP